MRSCVPHCSSQYSSLVQFRVRRRARVPRIPWLWRINGQRSPCSVPVFLSAPHGLGSRCTDGGQCNTTLSLCLGLFQSPPKSVRRNYLRASRIASPRLASHCGLHAHVPWVGPCALLVMIALIRSAVYDHSCASLGTPTHFCVNICSVDGRVAPIRNSCCKTGAEGNHG